MYDRLSEQIATLPSLNKGQLLVIWAENFSKDPPPNLRKELMVPILAYRMQEREFGGLSHGRSTSTPGSRSLPEHGETIASEIRF